MWHNGKEAVHIAIAGGDFISDTARTGNCIISRDGGRSWIRPSNPPYGYRSCIDYISASKLISCGLNGVDVSFDEGINWNAVSSTGFNVCVRSKKGQAVFLAGNNGRVARLIWK